jgi:hypothetical protein
MLFVFRAEGALGVRQLAAALAANLSQTGHLEPIQASQAKAQASLRTPKAALRAVRTKSMQH